MKFINAIAWVTIVWSALWYIVCIYLVSVERHMWTHLHYLAIIQRRGPFVLMAAVASILWLFFGE